MNSKQPIPTYVINLTNRTDRKEHTINEFKKHQEFDLQIVTAIEHERGAMGLWQTIQKIITEAEKLDNEFIIICQDDHSFTKKYSSNYLFRAIDESQQKDTDVLLGGVSWFADALQVSTNLFWVDRFTGLQFMVVFKKFYKKILETDFNSVVAGDFKISELTDHKLIMYPFISVQKEFGYSDVTQKNNLQGRVTELFNRSTEKLLQLDKVDAFYNR